MPQSAITLTDTSTLTWETLDDWTRQMLRRYLQAVLEDEVTELLGRAKSQRRAPDEPPVYRNGHGEPRRLTTPVGTITVQRPRVRGLNERFESRVLPLFRRRTPQVDQLLPELYLHGLAEGDFDLALRGLLGEDAPISAASVARLKAVWQQEYDAWTQRSLAELDVVYLWVDGVYVKAGLERQKAALLVAIGALRDGRKVVLAVTPGVRESTESWSAVLRDLQRRGLNCPRLVIGDGHLGIWGALANVFPEAGEQRCWNHRILNILDRIPKQRWPQAKVLLREAMYAPTRAEAVRLQGVFAKWCERHGCSDAAARLQDDWARLVAYYDFPREHWKHLRTTNPVESPFAAVRLRTTAAKRYRRVENATAVLCLPRPIRRGKTLLLAERRFRKLNAPELLPEVAAGVRFENGERVRITEKVAA